MGRFIVVVRKTYRWARSLGSPALGSIPCYESPRFSNSEMDLLSDNAVECLEDKCNSWGPEDDQHRARLAVVQLAQCRSWHWHRRFRGSESAAIRFQHSLYYVEHSEFQLILDVFQFLLCTTLDMPTHSLLELVDMPLSAIVQQVKIQTPWLKVL